MSLVWNALSSLDYGTGGKIIDDILDGGDFDWSNVGKFGMNSLSNFIGGQNAKNEQLEAEQRENAEYDRRVADERAYNDPSAQAQRLSDAGINPLSVMAGSSTASGNTTTAGAPNNSQSAMSDMLAFQQLQNETKIADATVEEKMANAERLRGQEGRDSELHPFKLMSAEAQSQIDKVESWIKTQTKDDEVLLKSYQVAEAKQTVDNLIVERSNLIKQGRISDKELEVMDKRIAEINSIIALNENNIAYNNVMAENAKKRLEFDKQVEERVKKQGLNALRIDAAALANEQDKIDLDKYIAELQNELGEEGNDINWSRFGSDAFRIAFDLVLFLALKKVPVGTGAKVFKSFIGGAGRVFK